MKRKVKKKVLTAALYVRVAAAVQDHDCARNQLSVLKKYSRKNGYKAVQTYVDNGYSGMTLNRPGMIRLREDAKKGFWKHLLICNPTRLARSLSALGTLASEFHDLGVEIVCTDKESEFLLLSSLQSSFAGCESEKRSVTIKAGTRPARSRTAKV